MATADIDGVKISYEIIGDSGPWVALITGARRGYLENVPLAEKLAPYGFRVLLHDRRNTGASSMLLDDSDTEEAVWADDLRKLFAMRDGLPAFVGGSSSGARTALMYALRHPDALRGLLLMRVTGGRFAADWLTENYYNQFIRIAEEGGMEAICATERYADYISTNPAARDQLLAMDPQRFIEIQTTLRDKFLAGAHYEVMGTSPEELGSITAPTIVIPGNDNTHNSASGRAAHRMIKGSELHELPITDQDVPLISWPDWADYEPEIARTFADFMHRVAAAGG